MRDRDPFVGAEGHVRERHRGHGNTYQATRLDELFLEHRSRCLDLGEEFDFGSHFIVNELGRTMIVLEVATRNVGRFLVYAASIEGEFGERPSRSEDRSAAFAQIRTNFDGLVYCSEFMEF